MSFILLNVHHCYMRKSHEFYFSGLDNPTKILSGGKDESESVQAKPRSKVKKNYFISSLRLNPGKILFL